MLEISALTSAYGRIEVLHGLRLNVQAGEIVTLVGANGAGKTTLMRAISGVQPVTGGQVRFLGADITRLPAQQRVRLGIAQVPEGRQVFAPLSVEDNLRLGAWHRSDGLINEGLEGIYRLFPVLRDKRRLDAGGLSGGQQQMLAIGRALMANPKLILFDEPSMGLAPILVDQVFAVIQSLKQRGITVLLVEQNAVAALAIADRAYVLETGRISMEGRAADLADDPRIREAYLGG